MTKNRLIVPAFLSLIFLETINAMNSPAIYRNSSETNFQQVGAKNMGKYFKQVNGVSNIMVAIVLGEFNSVSGIQTISGNKLGSNEILTSILEKSKDSNGIVNFYSFASNVAIALGYKGNAVKIFERDAIKQFIAKIDQNYPARD